MCVPTFAPRRWTQTSAAAPIQCAAPAAKITVVCETATEDKRRAPKHDISVKSTVPQEAFINDDAVRAASDAFQELCERNTRCIAGLAHDASVVGTPMPPSEKPTCFHSRQVPGLSLHALATAMHRNSRCGAAAQLVAIVLMARYCDGTGIVPTAHLMHRLYVACLHVGIKAHCDQYYRADHFAYFAGIDTRELLRQEVEVLRGAQWQVQVNAPQLHHMVEVVKSKRVPPTLQWFTETVASFGRVATPGLDAERSPSSQRSLSTEGSLDDLDVLAAEATAKVPPAPALPERGSSLDWSTVSNSGSSNSACSGPPSSDEETPTPPTSRIARIIPRHVHYGHRSVNSSKAPERRCSSD